MTDEPSVYGTAHSGDIVRGADGQAWGVERVEPFGVQRRVTLVRHGQRVTGLPMPETPVGIVSRSDVSAEAAAVAALLGAGLDPELISETWQP